MTLPALPPPREPGVYRLALVCLGNICRSPMAHVVLEARLAEARLDDRVHVRSAGTGGWHVDEPMDRRAAATLSGAGYDPSRHRGRRFEADDAGVPQPTLSTDMANVSLAVPTIHPLIGIEANGAVNHQREFAAACVTSSADAAVRDGAIAPDAARFDGELGEYVLPYAAVRAAADPAATLMEFLEGTYALAADLGQWDRAALERSPVAP